jgi:hypothetical protein
VCVAELCVLDNAMETILEGLSRTASAASHVSSVGSEHKTEKLPACTVGCDVGDLMKNKRSALVPTSG